MSQSFNKDNSENFLKSKNIPYYKSKSELFEWVNITLNLEIKGIEDITNGALFCQLLETAHPGTVGINRVNFNAKLESEKISNFKIFQQGLLNNKIDKYIDISRLSTGKIGDLIELLQWLYSHFISIGLYSPDYEVKKKEHSEISEFQWSNNIRNYINKSLKKLHEKIDNNLYYTKKIIKDKNIRSTSLENKKGHINNKKGIISNKSYENKKVFSTSMDNKNKKEKTIKKNSFRINPFIINDDYENSLEEKEKTEKLDSIFPEGLLSDIDKEYILETEKNDGNDINVLKNKLRKERVTNIKIKNNIGNAIMRMKRERDFFLNKLKDIEYLYFNRIIKNEEENKKVLLKTILSSKDNTKIFINEEGIASVKEEKENVPISEFLKTQNNNKIPLEHN